MVDSASLICSLSAFAFVNDSIDITNARKKVNLFINILCFVCWQNLWSWLKYSAIHWLQIYTLNPQNANLVATQTTPLESHLMRRGQCEATALLATTKALAFQRSVKGPCHAVTEGWGVETARDQWLQNSSIIKPCFVIPNLVRNLKIITMPEISHLRSIWQKLCQTHQFTVKILYRTPVILKRKILRG